MAGGIAALALGSALSRRPMDSLMASERAEGARENEECYSPRRQADASDTTEKGKWAV